MKEIDFKNSSFVIFLLISISYLLGNIIWWKLNTPIITQGICALHFLDVFENQFLYYNAPLLTWIMKGMFFLFGKESFDLQIIIVNYLFFLVGLYFIYKIGVELKDREVGNVAMILFALTPAIYGMSRQYGHQEYHVMVAMIANIYCLIKLNDFEDRKWSILYGITVGLGLLIKDEFLPYFFTPWLYVVIRSLIDKTDKNKIKNILITIAVGSLIAGCHYFNLGIMGKILHEPFRETVNIFDHENIRMMTIGLSDELLSLPIFLLFLVGFIWFIVRFKNKDKITILLWIIIPWFIIMFMPHHKAPEYNVGFIPAIILIISLLISNIKNKIIKISITLILIVILLLQFFDLSYMKLSLFNRVNYYKGYNLIFYDRTNVGSLMELMENLEEFKNKSFFIYNTDDYIMQQHTLIALMLLKGLNICSDISKSDIVIINGIEKSLKEKAEDDFELSNIAYFSDKNAKDNFINRQIEKHKKVENVFIQDFYLYKSWYLQNIKDEDHFVRLYKKK